MHSAATCGVSGFSGSGRRALAASVRTLPGVSEPSRVVRSTIEMARSIAASLAAFLIERVARPAARCSTPTGSTPGRPCRNRRSDASSVATSRRCGGRAGAGSPVDGAWRGDDAHAGHPRSGAAVGGGPRCWTVPAGRRPVRCRVGAAITVVGPIRAVSRPRDDRSAESEFAHDSAATRAARDPRRPRRHRGRSPAGRRPAVDHAGRPHRQRRLPGGAARADPDVDLRGVPHPADRAGADPHPGGPHHRDPAVQSAAAGAGAAGRARAWPIRRTR